MRNKIKTTFKKYPLLLGILCIFLIVLFICWRWICYDRAVVPSSVKTEDMKRKENVGSYTLSCEPIAYFLKAAEDQDLDQALRAFPIEELNSKSDLSRIVSRGESFSFDLSPAFSALDDTYDPIGNAEITAEYAVLYEAFLDTVPDLSDAELVRFAYIELSEEEEQYDAVLSDITGAKKFRRTDAYIRAGEKLYKIPFLLVKYSSDSWKVFDIDLNIEEVTEEDLNAIPDLTLAKGTSKKNKERIGDDAEEQIDAGDAFLPLNYTFAAAVYGDTPEDLMNQFELYVQKGDTGALLAFGNTGDEMRDIEQTDAEQIILQGEFAEELKEFYYTILIGKEVIEETSIYDLGLRVNTIVSALDPEYFFYSSMTNMNQITEDAYYVYWKYENEYYRFTFRFREYEKGWQISEIADGVKLTDEEYQQEISV